MTEPTREALTNAEYADLKKDLREALNDLRKAHLSGDQIAVTAAVLTANDLLNDIVPDAERLAGAGYPSYDPEVTEILDELIRLDQRDQAVRRHLEES